MGNQVAVVGTVRKPDGTKSAPIDGLVLDSGDGTSTLVGLPEAIKWAAASRLVSKVPGDGHWVEVVPFDEDSDGIKDSVRTARDRTTKNNLLDLPIWDRVRRKWVQ